MAAPSRGLSEDVNNLAMMARELTAPATSQDTVNSLVDDVCAALDDYQAQSYLLLPHLQLIAAPLLDSLRLLVLEDPTKLESARAERIAYVLYFVSKIVGNKNILRIFPHEVNDLLALVQILSSATFTARLSWQSSYVLLLWLSVACRIPFNLARMPGGADIIPSIGQAYLRCPGKEQEGAVLLLASWFSRQDASLSVLLSGMEEALKPGQEDVSYVVAWMQVLCGTLGRASPSQLMSEWSSFHRILTLVNVSSESGIASSKARTKLAGRLALLRLNDHSQDMPDEVETILQELLECLSAPDTVVRWSASKYIARITKVLPADLTAQVIEALLSKLEDGFEELEKAEHVLQGTCFTFGEVIRQGQLDATFLDRLVPCILKALVFDRRRGTQIVGSSIRDAAAYVLWATARSLKPTGIPKTTLVDLATRVVSVALYDREVHVRRAASAAYQELVGRWESFPHGIAVLRNVDFFVVGVRRRAFLEAAPAIAEFEEYRRPLIDHLLSCTLKHYDQEIRELGASSLGLLVRKEPALLERVVHRELALVDTKDLAILHGALLALVEASKLLREDGSASSVQIMNTIFETVAKLSPTLRALRSAPFVLASVYDVLAASCSTSAISTAVHWQALLDLAATRTEVTMLSAAKAVSGLSVVADMTQWHKNLLRELNSHMPLRQQWAALALGQFSYTPLHSSLLLSSIIALTNSTRQNFIEARCSAAESIGKILAKHYSELGTQTVCAAYEAILLGFNDYTVDQRGDVGSWVRLASLQAIESCLPTLVDDNQLSRSTIDRSVACCIKQTVEKLDNVREVAARTMVTIIEQAGQSSEQSDSCIRHGDQIVAALEDRAEWRNRSHVLARMLELVPYSVYRTALLEGAISTVSASSSDSPLVDYAMTLPVLAEEEEYDLVKLVQDLLDLAKSHFSSNRTFVPIAVTFGLLLELGAFDEFATTTEVTSLLIDMCKTMTRSLGQIKAAARLNAVSKIVVRLLGFDCTATTASRACVALLSHSGMPWVRQSTAEELLAVYGTGDSDSELDSILIHTKWSEVAPSSETVQRVLQLITPSI